MDHSLDFIELLGVKGVIKGISSAVKKLTGYAPESLVGKHFLELVHPDDSARASRAFAQVPSRNGPQFPRRPGREGHRGADPRRNIARELHDDVQQILVGLRLSIESSRGTASSTITGRAAAMAAKSPLLAAYSSSTILSIALWHD